MKFKGYFKDLEAILYKLLKRKYESNKCILSTSTKIWEKPVNNFLDTVHLYTNLKVSMKSGQPYRLSAIIATETKKHKKT